MKNFLVSHDIKAKDVLNSVGGAAVVTVATASLREQQKSRKQQAEQNLAQKNRDKQSLLSMVRRDLKDNIISHDEALNFCKREDIITEKECLVSAIEKKKIN